MSFSFHLAESDDKKDLPPLIFRTKGTTSTSSHGSSQPRRRLIEEITPAKQTVSSPAESQSKSERLTTAASHEESHSKMERFCVPDHSISVKEPDSKHQTRRVLVKVSLPGVSSANEVDLEVSKVSMQGIIFHNLLLLCWDLCLTNRSPPPHTHTHTI